MMTVMAKASWPRRWPVLRRSCGEVAAAYRNAEGWLSIAAALARKFGDTLHEPMDPGGIGGLWARCTTCPVPPRPAGHGVLWL